MRFFLVLRWSRSLSIPPAGQVLGSEKGSHAQEPRQQALRVAKQLKAVCEDALQALALNPMPVADVRGFACILKKVACEGRVLLAEKD